MKLQIRLKLILEKNLKVELLVVIMSLMKNHEEQQLPQRSKVSQKII